MTLRQFLCGLFRTHRWDTVELYPLARTIKRRCFNCSKERLEVCREKYIEPQALTTTRVRSFYD